MKSFPLFLVFLLLISACGETSNSRSKNAKTSVAKTKDTQENTANAIGTTVPYTTSNTLSLFSKEKASKADFDQAKANYSDTFIHDTLNIRKNAGVLKLKTGRGWKPYVIFTDTLAGTDDDSIREYKYLGHYKEINHYLVGGLFWEHYECYLIDKAKGKITTTWERPFISPDKQYLANLSMAYGLEGIPNGIQIWKVTHHPNNQLEPITIEKFIEIDQQIWAPYDFS